MRRSLVTILGAALVVTMGAVARADAPSPIPTQSAPLDIGSRTHGIGGAPAAQPAAPPKIDVRGADVPSGSGPDTPGKTGLGNTDRGPVVGLRLPGRLPQRRSHRRVRHA